MYRFHTRLIHTIGPVPKDTHHFQGVKLITYNTLGVLQTPNVTENAFNLPSLKQTERLSLSGPAKHVSPHLFCLCTEIYPLPKTMCLLFPIFGTTDNIKILSSQNPNELN